MDGWKILVGMGFVVLVLWLAIREPKERKAFERRAKFCEVTRRDQDNDVQCYRCADMSEQCWGEAPNVYIFVR